ncbi:MAG: hypothetical protein QOG05_694, partial [Streptosporangiaceae bacterium]|nr:hypothetical protein [Streptosporangiaceae bacterium]
MVRPDRANHPAERTFRVKCLLIRVGKVALRENVVACGWPQAGPAAAWWWPGVRNGAR